MATAWIDLSQLRKPLKFNQFKVNFSTERYNSKPLPIDIQNKLEDRWNDLLDDAQQNGTVLFNGSKFRLHSVETTTDNENDLVELTLNLGLTDYKSFISTQQDLPHELRTHIAEDHLAHPLGVACILITADDFIVLIKRSAACADLPNTYDIPGGHPEPKNVKEFTNKLIVEEIISSTIAECVCETNVDRGSLLIDTSFFIVTAMRSKRHYGRPVFEFCLRTTMTSNTLQERYNLRTHKEAYETTELKFWPVNTISDLLTPSNAAISINPACHAALTAYARIFH